MTKLSGIECFTTTMRSSKAFITVNNQCPLFFMPRLIWCPPRVSRCWVVLGCLLFACPHCFFLLLHSCFQQIQQQLYPANVQPGTMVGFQCAIGFWPQNPKEGDLRVDSSPVFCMLKGRAVGGLISGWANPLSHGCVEVLDASLHQAFRFGDAVCGICDKLKY